MSIDQQALSFLRPLRGLSEAELISFLDACVPLSVAAGTVLIHEGDADRSLVFVLDGTLEVRRGLSGANTPLRHYGRGEQLGELALIGLVRLRTATVKALTDAEVLVLEDTGMERLRAQGHPVADRIEAEALRALARRLREVDARIARLAHGDESALGRAPGWARLFDSLSTARSGRNPPRKADEVLERSAHFRRIPATMRTRLARHMEARPFAAGDAVVREGDIGGDAWIVATGEIGAWRSTLQDRHERLATLFPGTLFGQVSVVDGDARTATCTAESPAWLYRIPREFCQSELESSSPEGRALRRGLLDALTRQLQLANEHVTLLSMERTRREAELSAHP